MKTTSAIFISILICLIPLNVVRCVFVFSFQAYFLNESNTIVHPIVFFSFSFSLSLSLSLNIFDPRPRVRVSFSLAIYKFSRPPPISLNDHSTQFVADGLTYTYSIQPSADGECYDTNSLSNHRIVITSNQKLADKKIINTFKNSNNIQSTTASTPPTKEQGNSTRPYDDVNNNDYKCKSGNNNDDNNNNRINKIGNNHTTSKTSRTSTSTINNSTSSVNEVPTQKLSLTRTAHILLL